MRFKKVKILVVYSSFLCFFFAIIADAGASVSITFFSGNPYMYLALITSSIKWIDGLGITMDGELFAHRFETCFKYLVFVFKTIIKNTFLFTMAISLVNLSIALFFKTDYPALTLFVDSINIFLNLLVINLVIQIMHNSQTKSSLKTIVVIVASLVQFIFVSEYPSFIFLSNSLIMSINNSFISSFISYLFNFALILLLLAFKIYREDLV